MIWRVILCICLAGCSAYPVAPWPGGAAPVTPALLPTAQLGLRAESDAEARGRALGAQAAALKLRAAAIATD